MVNVEITCPPCDNFKQCPHKGKFIATVEEHRLYTKPVPYVRCPTIGRKIYLNDPRYYKIIEVKRYEPQKGDQKITTAHTSARSKWAKKARGEMTKRIKRRQHDPHRRRYGKKKK